MTQAVPVVCALRVPLPVQSTFIAFHTTSPPLFNSVCFASFPQAVRVKTAENQYPWTVVILTFFAMFLQLAPSSILIFGFAPLIINAIRSELKSD